MCQWLSGSASNGRPFTFIRKTNITTPSASGQESVQAERLASLWEEIDRPDETAIKSSSITKENSYNALIYNIFMTCARGSKSPHPEEPRVARRLDYRGVISAA